MDIASHRKLSEAQTVALRYLVIKDAVTLAEYRRTNVRASTWDVLVAAGLAEPCDTFPFHRATADGREWVRVDGERRPATTQEPTDHLLARLRAVLSDEDWGGGRLRSARLADYAAEMFAQLDQALSKGKPLPAPWATRKRH
jgi:hypothetical protein